jgi:hypothetical protein
MADQSGGKPSEGSHDGEARPNADELLARLLNDLDQLADYLEQRGRHTYDLAQRFLESARRNEGSRAFDERQATMLDYQHYIWHEIAGLVQKLVTGYSEQFYGEGGAPQQPTNVERDGHDKA